MPVTGKGIDVSEHQGHIDWEKVKPQIDFSMIRAGYGQGNVDKQFIRNITECNRLGIPCGVYWFSYAYNVEMAKREAEFCCGLVARYKINMPIVFDFEYDSVNYAMKKGITITKEIASEMVTAFCTIVEQHGYWATFYANPDYLKRYFKSDLVLRFDLWLASWYNKPNFDKPPINCGIWQYGLKTYNGIYGQVDSNVIYKDYKHLIKEKSA